MRIARRAGGAVLQRAFVLVIGCLPAGRIAVLARHIGRRLRHAVRAGDPLLRRPVGGLAILVRDRVLARDRALAMGDLLVIGTAAAALGRIGARARAVTRLAAALQRVAIGLAVRAGVLLRIGIRVRIQRAAAADC